ncbi:hypothetical protein ACROYT_G007034 [Oculina patagonica]
MRERFRLEKEKKNSRKEVDNSKDNGAKQKRKQTEDGADSQKKKKTQKQTEGDKEKDQKPASTGRNQTVRDRHTAPPRSQSKDKTPAGPTNSKRASAPRRGLHFQSAVAESSDDATDKDIEYNGEQIDIISDYGSIDCCKEKKLEVEALRKGLEKVHKRLNMALKAKTSEDVCWAGYVNAATDIFKETLAASNAKGNDNECKNGGGHQLLNPLIIEALVGKVCSKFARDSPAPSQVVQKINMKCVEARRPPRV